MASMVDVALIEYRHAQEKTRVAVEWGGGKNAASIEEEVRMALRHAVLLEAANVPCERVMEGA